MAISKTLNIMMNTTTIVNTNRNKIHPYKFTLWAAIASMLMMFAGLTSAFIVKSNLSGWRTIAIPKIFWVSTVLIIISSIIIHLAQKTFKERNFAKYRLLLVTTLVLGIAFVICQILGFQELWNVQNIKFKGSSGAGQFFYAIVGLHAVHVIGGMVALLVMIIKSYIGKTKNYNPVISEVMAGYWHFVDFLWIYLMIFFLIVG